MMLKQSAKRNLQRIKGLKVKQGLIKIFTLITVCIWLLYQLKHYYYYYSRDMKKSYEEISYSNIFEKVNQNNILLGRKGFLQPWKKKQFEFMDESITDRVMGLGNERDRVLEEDEPQDLIDEEDEEEDMSLLEDRSR